MRTPELDKHWEGNWYCYTCGFHTGQLEHHPRHIVSWIDPLNHDRMESARILFNLYRQCTEPEGRIKLLGAWIYCLKNSDPFPVAESEQIPDGKKE